MKRALTYLFITLLFINLVHSQIPLPGEISDQTTKTKIDFKSKSNEALDKEIKIPDKLQILARVLFGLKSGETVSLSMFIVFISVWIIFLILLRSIVLLIPFFNETTSWPASIVIMLLLGISGGIEAIAKLILWIGSLFGILKDWEIFSLIISIIVVFGLALIISKAMKRLGLSEEIDKMEGVGRNIGFAGEVGKIERDTLKS